MKNVKRILAVLLAVVMAVTMFAVSISGANIGDVVYAGQGDHEQSVADIMTEYFGKSIVRSYWPIGASDISATKDYAGGGPASFGGANGQRGGEMPIADLGIPAVTDVYTGAVSENAFAFDYSACDDGAYYSFGCGGIYTFAEGLVIEFDLYIGVREDGTTMLPTATASAKSPFLSFGPLTTGSASGGPHAYQMIKFTSSSTAGKWSINGKTFDAGQWQHITIRYVHGTATVNGGYEVYVGDDTTGRVLAATYGNTASGGKIEPYNWRIMAVGGNVESVERIYLDNFLVYSGSDIHNPFAAKAMSDVEAYTMCMNAVCDDTIPEAIRYSAYKSVSSNMTPVNNILNSGAATDEYRAAYEAYMAFVAVEDNVNHLIEVAKAINLAEYLRLANVAADMKRSLSNITDREKAISAAGEFLASVGDIIDGTSSDYALANATILKVQSACEADTKVNQFISYMNMYTNNRKDGFLVAMQRYYNQATEIYGSLPDPSVYSSDSKTTDYKNARNTYAGAEADLAILVAEASSVKFMDINEILVAFMAEGGDLLSEPKYRRMWDSAYGILKSGAYDAGASGMDEAIEAFYAEGGPHEFFWTRIQQEHIDILTEKLAGFESPNATYIDKAGICKYVQFYVNENSFYIDESNTTVFELVSKAREYEASLGELEEEYRELLLANSEKFLAAVAELGTLTDYASIKAKHDATKEYYYAMEILGGEEGDVMKAVVKYEQIEDWLADVETNCIIYIEAANALAGIEDENEIYLKLAEGYRCIEMIDDTYEGIKDAKTKYEAVYSAYEKVTATVNAEIYESVDAMCSVRCGNIVDNIVNFFRSLFN